MKICVKVASQAGLWYNKHRNSVLPERCYQHPLARIHLTRRCIMDTLPPHAQDGNVADTHSPKPRRIHKTPGEYTTTELSKITGVPAVTLGHVAKRGRIPARKVKNSWVINAEHEQFKQWLDAHWQQSKVESKDWSRKPCSVEGCNRPARRYRMCFAHAQRWITYGNPFPEKPIQEDQGRYIRKKDGYAVVPANGHPNGHKSGSILEHVKVMSEMIGRPLLPGENVHHKNGIRDDNRPINLELWTTSQPSGVRVSDLIRYALDIVEIYGTDPEVWGEEHE